MAANKIVYRVRNIEHDNWCTAGLYTSNSPKIWNTVGNVKSALTQRGDSEKYEVVEYELKEIRRIPGSQIKDYKPGQPNLKETKSKSIRSMRKQ